MSKVRRVGATINKNSNLIKSQDEFMKRWNVKFDNNNISSFRNRIINILRDVCPKDELLVRFENKLFYQIGMLYHDPPVPWSYSYRESKLLNIILKLDLSTEENQIKFLWWIENILNMQGYIEDITYLTTNVSEAVVASGINAQLCKSGSYYMFYPAGAELLDIKVVNDVLNWLESYPNSKEKYNSALLMFQKKVDARHIIDNLRLSFELFLKEFFENEKSLENQKEIAGKYLSDNNVPKEIRNMYSTLVSQYCSYNNENVKHNDKCSTNEIEFIIYLTGTFIRFLIQTKLSSK